MKEWEAVECEQQADRAEGAVAVLRSAVKALHQEIEWLAEQLRPVLREDSPEPSDELVTPHSSELEGTISGVEGASVRIARIRARLVV